MPPLPPTPPMPPQRVEPLSYPAMRLAWCRRALLALLRRWAVYVVVGAAVLGAGAAGYAQIISAAAAWLVLPLFYASAHGGWIIVAALLQALAGAGAVWALRGLMWPAAWGEAERALPISPRVSLASDLQVVLLGLAPLQLLQVFGALTVLGHDPAWLRPTRGRAVMALVDAGVAAVLLGVALLQRLRRAPPAGRIDTARTPARVPDAAASARSRAGGLRWPLVLLALPLWRGPARRTGKALLLGAAALSVPGTALAATGQGTPWWLASYALLALVVASRVNQLAREELAGLLQACIALPLAPVRLQRARATLGLWPVLPTLAGLCLAVLAVREAGLRPAVLAAWAAACLGSCAVEVLATPAEASTKAGRWLFWLVLCVCLATEVLR